MASVLKRFSMSKRSSKSELTRLKELSSKCYKDQAIWFLNAFWTKAPSFKDNEDLRETVWAYYRECVELDPKGEEGKELDELLAHRLLEKVDGVLTVVEMREVMRKVDVDFNKFVSLFEFLFYKFDADWKTMVNATVEQGGEEMERILNAVQELVDAAKSALEEAEALRDEATAAEQVAKEEAEHAKAEEAKAKAAEEEAHERELEFARLEEIAQKAEDEQLEVEAKVKAVVEELAAEEKAHEDRMKHLESQSARNSIGIVRRGKAKNELFQLKAQETVGLREARLRQEAALRRQQKVTAVAAQARAEAQRARRPFTEAKNAAVAARKEAEEARDSAERAAEAAEAARKEADAAVESSLEKYRDAEAEFEKVKAKFSDSGQGRFWFMHRELEEAKKFMSKKQLAELEGN